MVFLSSLNEDKMTKNFIFRKEIYGQEADSPVVRSIGNVCRNTRSNWEFSLSM